MMPPLYRSQLPLVGFPLLLFLRSFEQPLPPVTCQDLLPVSAELHWPSLVLGILLGLVLGQLLELLLTFRQYLVLTIRHRTWAFLNASAVKARLG